MRGGCRADCDLDAEVDLPAASPWMRGGGRLTCRPTAWTLQLTYLPPRREYEEPVVYWPPCCECKAAVDLPATWEARRPQWTYLLPCCECKAAAA